MSPKSPGLKHLATFPMAPLRAVCAMGVVEEDPVIGRGSGVKKVVVGGWGQGMGARGVVHGRRWRRMAMSAKGSW